MKLGDRLRWSGHPANSREILVMPTAHHHNSTILPGTQGGKFGHGFGPSTEVSFITDTQSKEKGTVKTLFNPQKPRIRDQCLENLWLPTGRETHILFCVRAWNHHSHTLGMLSGHGLCLKPKCAGPHRFPLSCPYLGQRDSREILLTAHWILLNLYCNPMWWVLHGEKQDREIKELTHGVGKMTTGVCCKI